MDIIKFFLFQAINKKINTFLQKLFVALIIETVVLITVLPFYPGILYYYFYYQNIQSIFLIYKIARPLYTLSKHILRIEMIFCCLCAMEFMLICDLFYKHVLIKMSNLVLIASIIYLSYKEVDVIRKVYIKFIGNENRNKLYLYLLGCLVLWVFTYLLSSNSNYQ
jgi:hypothetical protein